MTRLPASEPRPLTFSDGCIIGAALAVLLAWSDVWAAMGGWR